MQVSPGVQYPESPVRELAKKYGVRLSEGALDRLEQAAKGAEHNRHRISWQRPGVRSAFGRVAPGNRCSGMMRRRSWREHGVAFLCIFWVAGVFGSRHGRGDCKSQKHGVGA